jgi:O-antigen/teichoic acid export membrane protein
MIQDKRIVSGIGWNLLATLIARSAGLFTSVILSRSFSQDVFGEYSIIQSTIMTFGVFAGFSTGITATKYIAETVRTDPSRAGRILGLITLMALAFGIGITVLLFLGSSLITTGILASPRLTPLLQVASLGLVASSLSGAQGGALAGFEAFQRLSRVNIYSAASSILAVAAGVLLNGMPGALWGLNIAAVISCLLGNRALAASAADHGIRINYKDWRQEWPVLWRFSVPSVLANMLVIPVGWVCNAMLVNQPGGFGEMAVYNIATQWRQLLLFLPGVATQVFLPIMSSQTSGEQRGSQALMMKTNVLIAAPALLAIMIGSPLILAVYGRAYIAQWPAFTVVQLAAFAQIVQAPVVMSWIADGRMWTFLTVHLAWGALLVGGSWVLLPLGALGLGLALLVSFILYFLVISVMNRRRA